jgi:predicted nucleic acid-binding protein
MNGNRFLLDTNIILYILSGDKIIANYLRNKILYTSIICEIELLSYKSISLNEEKGIQKF